jgi:hypothetical protein
LQLFAKHCVHFLLKALLWCLFCSLTPAPNFTIECSRPFLAVRLFYKFLNFRLTEKILVSLLRAVQFRASIFSKQTFFYKVAEKEDGAHLHTLDTRRLPTRVTRLVEFTPIGRLSTLGSFL